MKARFVLIAICLGLALALTGSGPAPAAAQDGDSAWFTTCVDCPRRFDGLTDRSLRFDSSGQPHVVYGGGDAGQLYYGVRTRGIWQIEIVDPVRGTGGHAALALDDQGRPTSAILMVKTRICSMPIETGRDGALKRWIAKGAWAHTHRSLWTARDMPTSPIAATMPRS